MSGTPDEQARAAQAAESGPGLRLATRIDAKRTRELLRLAWPAVLSYSLNNAYRINDQFWVQWLGPDAPSALGATFFVQVLNFAFTFLAVGGTLALVSRSVGARDAERRDGLTRSALLLGTCIGGVSCLVGSLCLDPIVRSVGLGPGAAHMARDYLQQVFAFMVPMALLPVVDAIFIGRGQTRVPMILQACAVLLNYFLNPLLIYGRHAAEHSSAPGTFLAGRLGGWLELEGMGIAGAGMATGVSRAAVVITGLVLLTRLYHTRLLPRGGVRGREIFERMLAIARISLPSSASIAVYASTYILLLRYVLTPLGKTVVAGLGIGFQVFEGLAFPFYLGVSIAASSLVGREIGARSRDNVLGVVGSARCVARVAGLAFGALFWFGGPLLVPRFTEDPEVAAPTLAYVRTLAFSQYFVAVETVNEKVLLGSGQTRAILWISALGNLLRIPFGLLLAGPLGAVGVWWAINLTTMLKSSLFWFQVQAGRWLTRSLDEEQRILVEEAAA